MRLSDLLGVEHASAPADSTPGACGGQTSLGALADEVTLELGECAKNLEDQLPRTRRRIDALGQALEANAACLQVFHGLDEVR